MPFMSMALETFSGLRMDLDPIEWNGFCYTIENCESKNIEFVREYQKSCNDWIPE